jgi:hypothetical protein
MAGVFCLSFYVARNVVFDYNRYMASEPSDGDGIIVCNVVFILVGWRFRVFVTNCETHGSASNLRLLLTRRGR